MAESINIGEGGAPEFSKKKVLVYTINSEKLKFEDTCPNGHVNTLTQGHPSAKFVKAENLQDGHFSGRFGIKCHECDVHLPEA